MKKKEPNWFMRILTLLFIVYVFLFILNKTGYYEKNVRDKTIMTEEQIKQFEDDVANNIAVDINSYLPEKVDYSNFFTKGANLVSKSLGNVLDSKADNVWEFIKSLFIG